MYHKISEITFEAAHRIIGHPKYDQLHGHTWKIVISVSAKTLGITHDYPFVIDSAILHDVLRELAPDNRNLNELYSFMPSPENLAQYFYQGAKRELAMRHCEEIMIDYVEVWEGESNRAKYYE